MSPAQTQLAPTFDTLATVKRMKEAGVDSKTAEAITDAIAQATFEPHHQVATKDDLHKVESVLRKEINDVSNRLDKVEIGLREEINLNRFSLIKWMIGLTMANFALTITLFLSLKF